MRQQSANKTKQRSRKRGGLRSAVGVAVVFSVATAAGAAGATFGSRVCEGAVANETCIRVTSQLFRDKSEETTVKQKDSETPAASAAPIEDLFGWPEGPIEQQAGVLIEALAPAVHQVAKEVPAPQPARQAPKPVQPNAAQIAIGKVDTQRPSVPRQLRIEAGNQTVEVSWAPSTDNVGVVSYEIYFSDQSGVLGHLTGRSTETRFTDSGLGRGSYWYYIKAVDAAGNTSWRSGMKSIYLTDDDVADNEPPSIPTNLSAVAGGTSALLSWTASTDNSEVSGYEIYRSSQNGELGVWVGTSGSVEHDDDGLADGTYWYYLKAYDIFGNYSWRTGMRSVTIGGGGDNEPPSSPSGVQASVVPGSASVSLSWNAATDNVGVVSYRVYRTEKGVNFAGQVTASTSTSAVDTGVPDGEYSYYVRAIDAAGNEGERSGSSGFVKIGGPAPDTEQPSTPTGLTVTNVGTTEMSLSWNPSSDNVEVTHYVVIDQATGAVVQVAHDATAIVGGLAPGTAYSFFVKAVDGAENRSWRSNIQTFTTTH